MTAFQGLGALLTAPRDAGALVALRAGRPVRWGEFVDRARAWHRHLGACPGRRLALHVEDSVEFAAALFGAWHAGKAVVLPGDALPETLAQLAAVTDLRAGELPGAVVSPPQAAPLVAAAPALAAERMAPAAAWASAATGASEASTLDDRSTRLVVFTSGSSGAPVAIDKALAQLDAEVRGLQACFGPRCPPDALVWATVSHQHIYGLLFRVLWPLASGRPFVAERLVYPEEIAARIGAGGPALLVSSPAHLRRLPAAVDFAAARRALCAVFSSGGPLPPEAAGDSLARLGQSPIEVYGSSETGGVAWRQRALHGDTWTPFAAVHWRLHDDALAVRSPHLGDDGWFVTADRAEAAPAGGFLLRGRADRIVKIEEKRVSLTAIEQALLRGGLAAEARVLMLADELPGSVPASAAQRPAAVVVPTAAGRRLLDAQGKAALVHRLRAELLAGVERVALPRRWRFVDALPIDPQGKATERALARLFGATATETATETSPAPAPTDGDPPAHTSRPLAPLPHWLERGPGCARAELSITADLLVFDGHFPGAPVLPGLAQLDWAIGWARECFALPASFLRLEALKFQQPIVPGTRVQLELHWDAGRTSLQFEFRSAAGRHSSGRVVFAPDALASCTPPAETGAAR